MRKILSSRSQTRGVRALTAILGACLLLPGLQACSFSDLVDVDPLSIGSEISAKDLQTYAAAVMMYNDAVGKTAAAWSQYSYSTGYWTDELADVSGNATLGGFDARTATGAIAANTGYNALQAARGGTAIAIEALRLHPASNIRPLLAELFALQGYTVLMLGEGFCAGVPLSRVALDGDIHFEEGFSTEQLFTAAAALFDSAMVYASDSLPITTLMHVGAARAKLNLGEYDAAKRMAETVPLDANYRLYYSKTQQNLAHWSLLPAMLMNQEGGTGLFWIATPPNSQDVRLPVQGSLQMKYFGGVESVSMADGIEAGLIVAEAQLNTNSEMDGAWLRTLNTLRASWVSATGDRQLPDLSDPGTVAGRIDVLFQERAFWMYLTGHRQGDLRRLIRSYGRVPSDVYPWGDYSSPTVAPRYSEEVVFGIPDAEKINPIFRGCHDTNP